MARFNITQQVFFYSFVNLNLGDNFDSWYYWVDYSNLSNMIHTFIKVDPKHRYGFYSGMSGSNYFVNNFKGRKTRFFGKSFPNMGGWVCSQISQIWDKFPKNWTYKKIDKFHSPKCFRWTLPVRAISIFFFINFVVHIRTRKRQYKRFWRDAYHTYVRQNQNAPASNNSLLDIVSNLSPPNIWESGKRWGATKEFRSFYY